MRPQQIMGFAGGRVAFVVTCEPAGQDVDSGPPVHLWTITDQAGDPDRPRG
jgi:hypothetical protein